MTKILNSSLIPAVVAAVVALSISIWNTRLLKEKVRLDLYDKRFKIYLDVFDYCIIFIHFKENQSIKDTIFKNFIRAYRESQFLFSLESTVYNKIGEILQITANIKSFQERKEESSSKNREKIENNRLDLDRKVKELEAAMRPYLLFTVITKQKAV
ncbi:MULTISPECIES: hypothetical protein [Legionella]|uniref:hypothetical protein n=1 Tax=Legionella TaxID=445 RepID=UPI001AC393BD|nr:MULTISPECIES: hypothetical protein [Legionella]MBN9226017.1 hypothetical protein [Legionella steelei]